MTHRYYDAGAGRFVTRDPIGYKGGINLYGFAGNNPVNRRDPSGLSELDDLFRAADEKGQALQDSLRVAGQKIANGAVELLEDLTDSNSPDIMPDPLADPKTYAPGDFGYEPRPSTVTNRNGYRTPNGKFATPGGAERAGEPQADAVAESILRKRGFSVVGREVTVRANGLERRYDIVVRARSGNLIGVEVKSGTARLTASQRAFDQALNRSGRATVQAVGAYKGLTIRRAIVIRRP